MAIRREFSTSLTCKPPSNPAISCSRLAAGRSLASTTGPCSFLLNQPPFPARRSIPIFSITFRAIVSSFITAVSVWILTFSSSPPPPAIEARSESALTPLCLSSFNSIVAVALYLGVIKVVIKIATSSPHTAQPITVRLRFSGTIAIFLRDTSSSESKKTSLFAGRPAGWKS